MRFTVLYTRIFVFLYCRVILPDSTVVSPDHTTFGTSNGDSITKENWLAVFSNGSEMRSSSQSTCLKSFSNQKNNRVFTEHSTPLTRGLVDTANSRALGEISPLLALHSSAHRRCNLRKICYARDFDIADSPSLFSDQNTVCDINTAALSSQNEDRFSAGTVGGINSIVSLSQGDNRCRTESVSEFNELDLKRENTNESQCFARSSSDSEFPDKCCPGKWRKPSLDVQTVSDQMINLRLLDAKVCLDSPEALQLTKNTDIPVQKLTTGLPSVEKLKIGNGNNSLFVVSV